MRSCEAMPVAAGPATTGGSTDDQYCGMRPSGV
jgi:hypothetical protein